MTATPRSIESIAVGATLKLAFELESTKWTLGFTMAPAQRPRVRTIAAGDLVALEKEMWIAKARFVSRSTRRCRAVTRPARWLLAAPVVDGAGRGERGRGVLEHRSEPSGAAGEDGPAGCPGSQSVRRRSDSASSARSSVVTAAVPFGCGVPPRWYVRSLRVISKLLCLPCAAPLSSCVFERRAPSTGVRVPRRGGNSMRPPR
jgi:hypothetical protein